MSASIETIDLLTRIAKAVESIDLVADPATTKGFFESRGNRTVSTTLRAVIEANFKKLKAPAAVKETFKVIP